MPRSSIATSAGEADILEEGPLWNTIRRQLYRSEVSHIKRLVGDNLIQQNRIMWDEIASLTQILQDFQEQNDELTENMKKQVLFCNSQHRDLLRRQAQIIMEDVRCQAESSGHALEDLVPEFRSQHLRDFVGREDSGLGDSMEFGCKWSPPMTPSTRPSTSGGLTLRPSSSGGMSGCSTPDVGLPAMPLGRPLGFDELGPVAEGIREALEAEREALLSTISEQMQCLEAEEMRRASTKAAPGREPSTAELQQLVHKLQDLAVNPSMKALCASGELSPGGLNADAVIPMPVGGGSSVRRLKALIAQRRRFPTGPLPGLGAVREASSPATPSLDATLGSTFVPIGGPSPQREVGSTPREKTLGEMFGGFATEVATPAAANAKPGFDPFFDDPFA